MACAALKGISHTTRLVCQGTSAVCSRPAATSRMMLARGVISWSVCAPGTIAVTTCADVSSSSQPGAEYNRRPRKIERKMTTRPGTVGTLLLTRGQMDL
jgi:hypothetical protein